MKVRDFEMASAVPSLLKTLCVVMVFALLGDVVLGTTNIHQKKLVQPRGKRQTGNRQTGQMNDQLLNFLQEHNTSVDPSLLRYTPSTPSPEDVNCYVEVPVTRRVGGRCVLLGSSTWGCQAGIFLSINSDCQNETRPQTGDQSPAASGNSTRGGTRARNPFRRRRRPNHNQH